MSYTDNDDDIDRSDDEILADLVHTQNQELAVWRGIGERLRDGWHPNWFEEGGYLWGRIRNEELDIDYESLTAAEARLIFPGSTS